MSCRFLFLSLLFATMLLFGCTINVNAPPTNITKQTEQNTPSIVKTFECPNGKIVANISDCPKCPSYCDNGNPCTPGACNISTNYSCVYSMLNNISCGENKFCEEGVCKEKSVKNTNLSVNLTQNNTPSEKNTTLSVELSKHLENESRTFIRLINEKRYANQQGDVYLSEDKRLGYVAKKCGEEMLKHGIVDLNFCYQKYGRFKDILSELEIYGNSFFFASETTISPDNLSRRLFENLSSSEQNLLINQSIDRLLKDYSLSADKIGVSIDCDKNKCIQTSIIASNKLVERYRYENWGSYRFDLLPIKEQKFVPIKLTLNILDRSSAEPAWCRLYRYQNTSINTAESNYWWWDYWNMDSAHTYYRMIDWMDFYTEKITNPEIIYAYCYSTKSNDDTDKKKGRDRFELIREYLPENSTQTETDIDAVLAKLEDKNKNRSSEHPEFLTELNEIRIKKGFQPIIKSDDLSVLTKSCVDMSLLKKDYTFDSCYEGVFGNSSSPFSYTLATRDMFGSYFYGFNIVENLNNSQPTIDDAPDRFMEYLYGNSTSGMEYLGASKSCDTDVCIQMFILGSNNDKWDFRVVKKDWRYANTVLRWIKAGTGTYLDQSLYPNISFVLNSSVKANAYLYKNKIDNDDLWENGYPKSRWYNKTFEPNKYIAYNISPGAVYSIIYEPKFERADEIDNQTNEPAIHKFTLDVRYTPVKPVK